MVLGTDGSDQANGKRVLTLFNARFAAKEIAAQWLGLSGDQLEQFVNTEQFEKTFKEFDYHKDGTIDQSDAYFWASKLVGETYEGVVSSNEC